MAASASDDEVSSSGEDVEPAEVPANYGGTVGIDIREINNTLTEVHQQYQKLVQKYSRALNLIDDLKCQLAYDGCLDVKSTAGGSFDKLYEENRSQINNSHSWQWSASQITASSIEESSAHQVCSHEGIQHSRSVTPLSEDIEHFRAHAPQPQLTRTEDRNDAGFQLFSELFSPQESNICATSSASNCSLYDTNSSAHTPSCCQTQVERLPRGREISHYQSSDEQSPGNSTQSHLVKEQGIKLIQGQQSCHQIAVVYPAQRNIKLCTVGCCGRHSCCCCPHTPHSQMEPLSQNNRPVLAEFSDEEVSRSLQPAKPSGSAVTASKLLQALQEAVQCGAELRKSSSDLLHCFE